MFLDFDTNITESIKSISISGSHLMVAGDHVYNHYIDCRDANYFLSEDSIYDVLALPGEKVNIVHKIGCICHPLYLNLPVYINNSWFIWTLSLGKTSNSCVGLSGSYIESFTGLCIAV